MEINMKDFLIIIGTFLKVSILLIILLLIGYQAIYYIGYNAGKKKINERKHQYEQHHQYIGDNIFEQSPFKLVIIK